MHGQLLRRLAFAGAALKRLVLVSAVLAGAGQRLPTSAAAEAEGQAVIRSATPVTGSERLALRLRDVHVAEVFRALHELTGDGFVVDGNIGGRTSVEIAAADVAVALAEVARGADLAIAREQPVWRVRRSERQREIIVPPRVGVQISMKLSRAEISDLTLLFKDVGEIDIVVPDGDLGEASVFASDIPWDTCLWQAFDAAGLRVRRDGERRIVAARDPGFPGPARTRTPRRLSQDAFQAEMQAIANAHPGRRVDFIAPRCSDVDLAGVGRFDGEWRFFAYMSGQLDAGLAGQRLLDGAVETVDRDGATFVLDGGGRLRVLVPPLPPVSPE
jgi:hypothetical protein